MQKISVADENVMFMREACWYCDNSNCEIKTGCIAVRNGKVILKAWNSIEKMNLPKKSERENAVHAEKNLFDKALERNLSLRECTLYTTRFPCLDCAQLLSDAGIIKIFYMSDLFTKGNAAQSFFEQNNIETFQIKEGEVWDGTYQT